MNKFYSTNKVIALKIAAIYLVLSILWIIISDKMLAFVYQELEEINHFQTYKGLFFISVSALIIFLLVFRELRKKTKLIEIIKSNMKFGDFLEGNYLDILSIVFDSNRQIISIGGDLKLVTEKSSDELSGRVVEEITGDSNLREFIEWNSRKVLLGQEIRTEFHFNNKMFSFKGGVLRNEKEEIIAGIFIIIDQTKHLNIINQIESSSHEYQSLYEEFVSINDELLQSEEKFKILSSSISDVIWIADENKKVTYVSPSIYNFSGYTPEEILHCNLNDMITDDSIKLIFETDQKIEETESFEKNKNLTIQIQQIHKNGRLIDIELSMNLIYDEKQQLKQVIGVTRDISERKKIERQLMEAKKKAEESDRLKSAFLTNISHEIRTPMNSIIGFSEILCDESTDAESRKKFGNIVKNSGLHLLDIINDILDISKLETDILTENKTWFALNELMDELKDTSENRIQSLDKKIIVRMENYYKDGNDHFYGEKTRIFQVFNNLLVNAIKFTREGYIDFGYSVISDAKLLFWVKDTGIGIDFTKQRMIFDRFRQVEENISRQYGGIGLGLSISKGLVNWMEGEIWVESEPSKGSVFYFTIPITRKIEDE